MAPKNTSDWKNSVRGATTATTTIGAHPVTVDGITPRVGDRFLLWKQTDGKQNGIYTIRSGGMWSRSDDANQNDEIEPGMTVFVEEGTANGKKTFVLSNTGRIVIGQTALVFSENTSSRLVGGGTATLVGGSAVVSDTRITASTIIICGAQASGSANGDVSVSARTAGTSFTITSESGSDDRLIGYILFEPTA